MVTLTGVDPQQNPTATAGTSYSVSVGDAVSHREVGSTDANPGDIPYLSFSWDVNGDGVFGDAFGLNPTLDWSQLSALGIAPGQEFNVRVRVDDSFGGVTDSLAVPLAVVPEPASWLLAGLGMLMCIMLRRKPR